MINIVRLQMKEYNEISEILEEKSPKREIYVNDELSEQDLLRFMY